MCGIAGMVDVYRERQFDPAVVERMAAALWHRGPDEGGAFHTPGVSLASRRLSIVGLADGRQPIFNEDGTVVVVFNGELFDYVEKRQELEKKGHRFATSCDTEVLVHMWEEYGEDMLVRLRGQFAFALYDMVNRVLLLARDRIGIVPLHWARRGDTLYFGSEIKAIFASGEVPIQPDPLGIDHVFTFFGMGTRRTAFQGVSSVHPAGFVRVRFREPGRPAAISEGRYWDLDFPDAGEEYRPRDKQQVQDEFEAVFRRAVEIRLRSDVPVVGYLSGGVDSTSVMLTASDVLARPILAFTIKIDTKGLDETGKALLAAEHLGCPPTIVTCNGDAISDAYPNLTEAAEAPVIDTSSAALYCLAEEVHRQGFKVALTGEGADDLLGGYPWFKFARVLGMFDVGRFRPGNWVRRWALRRNSPEVPWKRFQALQDMLGGPNGCADFYGMVSLSRQRFYSPEFWKQIGDHSAFDDLDLNTQRMKRWHPLNRTLYLDYKTMLSGTLMNHKGDRPAMHNSVETRYPFLDEEVVELCAKIHPSWKLRGIRRDKHLLRTYASKILPSCIANRPKAVFRAPFANSFFLNPPPYVDQLLSDESLKKTGYFLPHRVSHYRKVYNDYGWFDQGKRIVAEMGLTGVMATQLWHHLFIEGGLCELPTWSPAAPERSPRRERVVTGDGPNSALGTRTPRVTLIR